MSPEGTIVPRELKLHFFNNLLFLKNQINYQKYLSHPDLEGNFRKKLSKFGIFWPFSFYYESKQYFRPCVNEFKISFWALLQKGKWQFFRGGGDLNHSERFEAVDGHRATVETII